MLGLRAVMNLRIGTDLCNPKRIATVYKRFGEKFLNRILTNKEKDYVLSSKKLFLYRLAGRYAAKEAVAKLLGTGIAKQVSFRDIEILRDTNDAPSIQLSAGALKRAEELGLKEWTISVSHEKTMVIAIVIAS